MFNPTAGSPTITLFQLRSNCHTLLNSHKLFTLIQHDCIALIKCKITKYVYLETYFRYFFYIEVNKRNMILYPTKLRSTLWVYRIKYTPNLNLKSYSTAYYLCRLSLLLNKK